LTQSLEESLAVLVDPRVPDAGNLLQRGFGSCPPQDHLGQLLVAEDGVHWRRIGLGDLLAQISQLRETSKSAG
jgi:hypothetical protein